MPGSPPSSENRRQNKNVKNRSSVASRMTNRNNNNSGRNNGHKKNLGPNEKWDNVSLNVENLPLVFSNQNLQQMATRKNPNNKPPSPMKIPQNVYRIPDSVLGDICFRFLDNIPDHEKIDEVRVCFQIEQAHWFYEDFVCKSKNYPECKHVGFKEFARQIFNACDYLDAWKGEVDSIIDHFRLYKSNVPTYGAILLDETLTYVLLVQGWFATKNNWGFPKGKVNENEDQTECAIREVFEEVGYDISNKINPNIMFTNYINDTMVCLYVATGVEMGFPFKPHARKEIRKIQWFSVWDLPVDRFDHDGCARLELTPQNFYTVLPFVKDIQAFIRAEQAKRMKAQPKVLIGQKSSSAFEPVVPKPHRPWSHLPEPSFQQSLIQSLFPNNMSNFGGPTILTTSMNIQQQAFLPGGLLSQSNEHGAIQSGSNKETLFKPLKLESTNQPSSFTGEAFLEMLTIQTAKSPTTASQNPGVIGGESLSRRKEIKHPKPLHSNLKICVYEAPNENQNTQKPKEKVPEIDLSLPSTSTAVPSSFVPYSASENEIANMLMSAVTSTSHLEPQPQPQTSTTPQRNKKQRPNPSPSSNAFLQQSNQKDSTSPSNLEPSLQTSGSMRKRGSRGRKRNRGKSQTEHAEKGMEKEKEDDKKAPSASPKPETSTRSTITEQSHWQSRGISIDLNALFGAAAKASTSQASLSPRPEIPEQTNSTSPVLRLLQNLSLSPGVPPVQAPSTSSRSERIELSASPYDNHDNGNGHQHPSNSIEDRNSHEPEGDEEDKDRPIIQLCNTWKSFKFDTSKLLFA